VNTCITMAKKRGNDRDRGGDGNSNGRANNKRARRESPPPPQTRRPSKVVGPKECTVFVGNLSYRTSWQDLKDEMRKVGTVLSVRMYIPCTEIALAYSYLMNIELHARLIVPDFVPSVGQHSS
jgi:RNA recognition motif-containing protein